MQMMFSRIILILSLFVVINPSSLQAATEERIALVIGNSAYSASHLKNPVNDATAMATQLEKLGFTVILKKNVNLRGMEEALTDFGDRLKRGGVGLFFYAGHGLQTGGVNYLVPVGARINRESDIKYETLDVSKILDEMLNANNGLNIVILDACRDNPYSRSFRSVGRGLAIVSNAPVGTFISYSTGPGNVARDGDGRNSPYTEALLRFMTTPGLTIEQVFKSVRAKLVKETRGTQIPWEISSLQGEFYFVPRSEKTFTNRDELSVQRPMAEQEESRMAEELKKMKKDMPIATAKQPSLSTANEIGRDGPFIAYDNGTVFDTRTNLMWAAKDNGSYVGAQEAESYCENYRGGGFTDWRMPTYNELAGLFDNLAGMMGKSYDSDCPVFFIGTYNIYLTKLIRITCPYIWSKSYSGSGWESRVDYRAFNFNSGGDDVYFGLKGRALPVRGYTAEIPKGVGVP